MSSRSLHKKNSGKLQSLKCFELKFAVADSQIERGNTILCKMERPSPTGIMHFYKMPVNTLSPPSVIRDSTPEGHLLRTTLGSLATEKVKDTAKLR